MKTVTLTRKCADCPAEVVRGGNGQWPTRCRPCMKARKDAKTAAWREANAERLKAREAARYQGRRETVLARLEANRKMKLYGLTEDEVDYLRLSQHGLCAVCKKWLTKETIDHDHATGRVRGLLCPSCNSRRVPVIEECLADPALMEAIKAYLAA